MSLDPLKLINLVSIRTDLFGGPNKGHGGTPVAWRFGLVGRFQFFRSPFGEISTLVLEEPAGKNTKKLRAPKELDPFRAAKNWNIGTLERGPGPVRKPPNQKLELVDGNDSCVSNLWGLCFPLTPKLRTSPVFLFFFLGQKGQQKQISL